MERILKQRDRLLAASARLIGLTSTAVAFLLLVLGGTPLPALLIALPLFVVLAGVQFRMGSTKAVEWPIASIVLGLATIVLLRCEVAGAFAGWIGVTGTAIVPLPVADAMRVLSSASIAAAGILLTISLGRMLVLVGAFAATMITVVVVFAGQPLLGLAALSTLAGWSGLVAAGSVLSAGLLRAARRVSSIGRAHRSERQASETEAQRRQGARLLHDTVLATLTLLAHSGVGVSREALRRQAGDDARLLRQLRLSATPLSMSAGAQGGEETADGGSGDPGGSLESVRNRFERLGLDVSWHGAASVTLPPGKLDAFLLALGECLENVRRHSGVKEAHVTITDDETTVRALVTDNGTGFEPAAVPAGKLGYRESIVGRLVEIGGNARVFSAQGSGTTVVLEVPR
ncbi:ATP-binding protein [Amnibacterium sp.]|uniref:sensor histidine kinase n=1 Tax=Amnibacterium sp. TaxID=1872496 RepID=UPI002629B48C|nr:ATP-binding protein [Amnibacterium sp.]MCU1474419.1 histidine kinase [Amnibacterium sp.]